MLPDMQLSAALPILPYYRRDQVTRGTVLLERHNEIYSTGALITCNTTNMPQRLVCARWAFLDVSCYKRGHIAMTYSSGGALPPRIPLLCPEDHALDRLLDSRGRGNTTRLPKKIISKLLRSTKDKKKHLSSDYFSVGWQDCIAIRSSTAMEEVMEGQA